MTPIDPLSPDAPLVHLLSLKHNPLLAEMSQDQLMSGLGIMGVLKFSSSLTPNQATRSIFRTVAKNAFELDLPFDPFNVTLVIEPIRDNHKTT